MRKKLTVICVASRKKNYRWAVGGPWWQNDTSSPRTIHIPGCWVGWASSRFSSHSSRHYLPPTGDNNVITIDKWSGRHLQRTPAWQNIAAKLQVVFFHAEIVATDLSTCHNKRHKESPLLNWPEIIPKKAKESTYLNHCHFCVSLLDFYDFSRTHE